ncbi:MAG: hypothetical protein AAF290_11895 [Pseudomonadota bacterium]
MSDVLSIASRIRSAREQAQMEPAELRVQLRDHGIDLSKAGLHRVETQNPKNPNLKLIKAIAQITRVSPSWILFGEGSAIPGDQVGQAIRGRVIDTIELLVSALDLNSRQQSTIENWLHSVRQTRPKSINKP